MDSFNVYGQSTETIGGNTPVWLGTVKPVPRGYILDLDEALMAFTDGHIPAGTPVELVGDGVASVLANPISAVASAVGYIYNDVYIGKIANESTQATCAVVMHHPEGLLIERVYPEITEEQIAALQAKIPEVLLVRG